MDAWLATSRRLYGLFTLVGMAGFVGCALRHVCCGGHMAHPPYLPWDYAMDAGWVVCFAAAAICGLFRGDRPFWLGVTGLAVLAASRLLTGSGSGFFLILFEAPLACAVSIGALFRSVIQRERGAA